MNDDLLQKQTICFYVNGRWEPTKELVRCKDCKFYRPNNSAVGCLKVVRSENADGEWYCAEGERRDDDA